MRDRSAAGGLEGEDGGGERRRRDFAAGTPLGGAPRGFPATDDIQRESETGELLLRNAKFAQLARPWSDILFVGMVAEEIAQRS